MYFDEDMLLDIRLHALNKFVYKFIICEAKYKHNGSEKKLNFDIKKFKKFENKINYIVLEDQPKNLHAINDNDQIEIKKNKIIDNGQKRETYQRNFSLTEIKKFSEEDLIIINDLDEIPDLNKFNYKKKITIFKQKMYYYKFNLEYPDFEWMGSKICKIKHLQTPQWLRSIKSKKYPIWRLDTFFSKKKYSNIEFVDTGGWHFTNIMTPEILDKKMRAFSHHLEYEESGYNPNRLKELIQNKKVLYNHAADKKDDNKWQEGVSLQTVSLEELPDYINDNKVMFAGWID
jgi:beta-1,4-mannosyl-glycoprotein beta-1,4-N-acetylglucosaminyltransferase